MRIKQETFEVMVLEESPLKGYIVGIVLIFFGIAVALQSGGEWLGYGIIGVGGLVIFMSKRITVFLDKKERKIVFERRSIVSGKREEYDLGAATRLEICYKRMRGFSGSNKKQPDTLNLILVLNDSKDVVLSSYRPVARGVLAFFLSRIYANDMANIGEKVARFLNVPFKDYRQVNMAEALSFIESNVQSTIQRTFGDKDGQK